MVASKQKKLSEEKQNQIFNEIINKTRGITGIDVLYFLDSNFQILKEHKLSNTSNYLTQITNILKSGSNDILAENFNLQPFHTYTFLSENGLILISSLQPKKLYMIIIAGENEPADLISLLKICKEARISSQDLLSTF